MREGYSPELVAQAGHGGGPDKLAGPEPNLMASPTDVPSHMPLQWTLPLLGQGPLG